MNALDDRLRTDGAGQAPEAEGARAEAVGQEDCATFRSIYTSRDGRLAVFEDDCGHLTSVRTARFA
jgi:hypothetical protein